MEIKEVKDYLKNKYPKFKGFIEHTIVAEMALNFAKEHYTKQLSISRVVGRSEQLPSFDVQEINEILHDSKEKQEDLETLVCRIWNKGYMTAITDEREG